MKRECKCVRTHEDRYPLPLDAPVHILITPSILPVAYLLDGWPISQQEENK